MDAENQIKSSDGHYVTASSVKDSRLLETTFDSRLTESNSKLTAEYVGVLNYLKQETQSTHASEESLRNDVFNAMNFAFSDVRSDIEPVGQLQGNSSKIHKDQKIADHMLGTSVEELPSELLIATNNSVQVSDHVHVSKPNSNRIINQGERDKIKELTLANKDLELKYKKLEKDHKEYIRQSEGKSSNHQREIKNQEIIIQRMTQEKQDVDKIIKNLNIKVTEFDKKEVELTNQIMTLKSKNVKLENGKIESEKIISNIKQETCIEFNSSLEEMEKLQKIIYDLSLELDHERTQMVELKNTIKVELQSLKNEKSDLELILQETKQELHFYKSETFKDNLCLERKKRTEIIFDDLKEKRQELQNLLKEIRIERKIAIDNTSQTYVLQANHFKNLDCKCHSLEKENSELRQEIVHSRMQRYELFHHMEILKNDSDYKAKIPPTSMAIVSKNADDLSDSKKAQRVASQIQMHIGDNLEENGFISNDVCTFT